jgi:hypothetical protein
MCYDEQMQACSVYIVDQIPTVHLCAVFIFTFYVSLCVDYAGLRKEILGIISSVFHSHIGKNLAKTPEQFSLCHFGNKLLNIQNVVMVMFTMYVNV